MEKNPSLPPDRGAAVDPKAKNFLTEIEMERFLTAARQGRHGARDYCMFLLGYRHGLRVSELVGIRGGDPDLDTGRLFVRRKKNGLSTDQPMGGDEIRAIRAWLRTRQKLSARGLPLLFISERGPLTRQAINYLCAEVGRRAGLGPVNPHQLRHSCGFKLANDGQDLRLIQDYLGHQNVKHTVRYTRTAASRFEGLFE